ncbi:helix-turn-helix transcriptional regulator [Paraburkholderia megapolitana]|uniref:Transcriptional regulator, LuxR family n=1 Tax=Paraburkholderia megapolitana TaxID=420953 RepID=A0A1I3KLY4_9BURK|nr:helix-turn-helix transcriptional regulator [Paraburkholderia megapolitana]QDQ80387.1 helix-turn-helix transcriptional regulator [Paraburkholderia megapolitana]SFI73521.1 transcriptional regulator, LuxR family [Paraburkholderia megapolitana]
MNTSDARPQADRRQLQQIIAGLTEGIILIDPDGSIVWANETALAIHGVETVDALGGNPRGFRKKFKLTYRNNHALQADQYPIARIIAGELFSDVIVEVTRSDDEDFRHMHQVRSLILTDASGASESLALVVQDVTERFSAEERFEKTFNANPAPAVICRLADLRYVKVNQGFLEMTGYARENVIGRSTYEVDVLEGADKREQAIVNLNEGRTIGQMEATLQLPDGTTKLVIVAGQPIEIGEENCMLFTFMDMEPRRKAEDALRHTEERFSKAFRLAPVPMTVSSLDGFVLMDVNDAFVATTGYEAEEVVARQPEEIGLWSRSDAYRKLRAEMETHSSVRNYEIQLQTKSGVAVDCLVSAEAVTIHGERCLLSVIQDITERKRSEVELLAAIEAVMKDTSWFSRTVIEKLAQIRQPNGAQQAGSDLSELTSREREVLGLICQGYDNEQIAEALNLAPNTIRNHVATLYSKIGVHRRSAAIVWARERGIVGYEKPKRRTGGTAD